MHLVNSKKYEFLTKGKIDSFVALLKIANNFCKILEDICILQDIWKNRADDTFKFLKSTNLHTFFSFYQYVFIKFILFIFLGDLVEIHKVYTI